MKRILIGGTHSGCGKTTVTCALLSALRARGLAVSSFKCGPDYIDPMFHRELIGTASANLDSFFCTPPVLRALLAQGSAGTDISVIEGVMGYYDGMRTGGASYDIARLTETPAVIVVNARGMHESLEAVMEGYLRHLPDSRICGFLFNQLPPSLAGSAEDMCCRLGTAFIGYLPRHEISLESRNLGLVTAEEIPDLQEKLTALGTLAESYIDLDRLLELAECGEGAGMPAAGLPAAETPQDGPCIAVSRDRAFCFRYPENIRLLEALGCRILYFSPLSDAAIPLEADGLYLCGGYPELHARRLSENESMRESIRTAVCSGLPTIAECGGFLYLHRTLQTEDGTVLPMAGVLDAAAFPHGCLHHFGYITMTALEDNLLCKKGAQIRAHEFHYWDSDCPAVLFEARKQDGRSWMSGTGSGTLYAGFPHLYFPADPQMAQRFVRRCGEYRKDRGSV